MMVGREAGRQDLVPRVWGEAEAHQQVCIQPGMEKPGRQGEERAREGEYKRSPVKGPDMPREKMKITGALEPLLRPTSMQGLNTSVQNHVCARWGLGEDRQPAGLWAHLQAHDPLLLQLVLGSQALTPRIQQQRRY